MRARSSRTSLTCSRSRTSAEKPTGFTPADYCQHIRELKKKVPAKGFTILIQPPFVVIGDEQPDTVRTRARTTVKWAVERIKQDYFQKDPPSILDIWLFKDNLSYEEHTTAIFKEKPTTPYGFYSEANQALIMNIKTGGGTLIHEILHPFTRANFPQCPAWLFEGLGSLYEQSSERDGHIVGLTNWRLKGLLIKFYKTFVANHEKDPSGYETLQAILGEKDMTAFEKKRKKYVLQLTFP